ncbi:MAG: hypothetical protein B6245_15945 [Desulfobacteraceae bacterium 4572_88]|nr:MAG: hypothetical protein B6245_15945 [Desulfobacteraceae bacterium 4572_88]
MKGFSGFLSHRIHGNLPLHRQNRNQGNLKILRIRVQTVPVKTENCIRGAGRLNAELGTFSICWFRVNEIPRSRDKSCFFCQHQVYEQP